MSNNSGFFAFMTIYWKASWKWFLGLIAGMAALELGLILYYINGGYRYLFIRHFEDRLWPMEYRGLLKSIRLEYMLPVLAVVVILLLVFTFYSFNDQKSYKLTRRIPISRKKQILYRIEHSFLMIVYVWLVQFLIIIAGFFLYRSNAPEGLNINFQMYNVFDAPGVISEYYPIQNSISCWPFILGILLISLLPAYIVDTIEQGKFVRTVMSIFIVWIAGWILVKISLLTGSFQSIFMMAAVDLIMIWSLFVRDIFTSKSSVTEEIRNETLIAKGDKDL